MNNIKIKLSAFLCKIGYNIMLARVNKGLSLPAVAKAMGISAYALKNIERGYYPKLCAGTVHQLSICMKVSLDVIFKDI